MPAVYGLEALGFSDILEPTAVTPLDVVPAEGRSALERSTFCAHLSPWA